MIWAQLGGECMNRVGLVGRITKDPSCRVVSATKMCTSFVLAVNRNFKNSQGKVDADFIMCVAWGKLAERIEKYCGKGSLIGIDGKLQTRSYTNKDNVKVYTMEVIVEDVRFYQLKDRTDISGTPELEIELEENFEVPTEQFATT